MELSGFWQAAPGDDELRLRFHDDGFDDSGWDAVLVPGHWQSSERFRSHGGSMLYRTRFELDPGDDATTRWWLTLDGVHYQSDVWLDGAYLGDTEGYFAPHSFEITDIAAQRSDHVLAVDVISPGQTDQSNKRALVGIFDDRAELGSGHDPGGIWRPVRIESSGPVRLGGLRVVCRDADETSATIVLHADLDALDPGPVDITTVVAGIVDETSHHLAAGENQVEWSVAVPEPRLWWPHTLGDQPLVDVAVEVSVDGTVTDRTERRTGLRSLEMRKWVLSVNGRRIFLKGANLAPTRPLLGSSTAAEVERDLDLALDAGLDLLRVRGHIGHPALYDAADRLGILLWQDLPLHRGYTRTVRRQATRQAIAAANLLAHHPSIAIWCGHNAPAMEVVPYRERSPDSFLGSLRELAGHQLPTWNRSILDRSVKSTLRTADGSRPVVPHSGVLPHPPQLDGTDTHLWFGWRWGNERDLAGFCARLPRLARFVGEFGSQAAPDGLDRVDEDAFANWPDIDWDHLTADLLAERRALETYIPPSNYRSPDGWVKATQRYQAQLVRRQIETLRRLKYRPTGGFCLSQLADPHPAIGFGVLDNERRPKAAWDALRYACRPVIVVADRLPLTIEPGQPLVVDIHAVSDLPDRLEDAQLTARISWAGKARTWQWVGDIPADEVTRVGTLEWVAPAEPGRLTLDILLSGPIAATNRYDAVIA